MIEILPATIAFLYLAAALMTALRLFSESGKQRIPRLIVLFCGFLAVVLHAILLSNETITDNGINLAFFEALSLGGWMIAAVIVISAMTKPVENLAIFLFPGIALAVLLADYSVSDRLLDASSGWALGLHVVTSLLAWSLLAIASVQAILLTIQDRHLHNRQPGGFVRALPPLQTMESLLFEMITAGQLLLTLSLITGFLFLEDMFAQHLVHKTLLSIVAWIVFSVLLWGRFRFGWRGRKALKWTIAGFVFLLLGYFGSKAVVELILQY